MDNLKDLLETFAEDETETVPEQEAENADAAVVSAILAKLDRVIELLTEDKKVEDKVDRKENEIEKDEEGDEE